MLKSVALVISVISFFIVPAVFAQVKISTNIPGPAPANDVCGFVSNFYTFSLMIAGILAFGAIVYGGVKYTFAAGNPSGQSEGKEWVKSALLGLLLLVGAYVILNTINPGLVKSGSSCLSALPGIAPSPSPSPTPPNDGLPPPNSCTTDLRTVATSNHEPFPATNASDLTQLMNCITTSPKLAGVPLGSVATYDHDHPTCNYTRGNKVCDTICSHAVSSCHYGGHGGTQGALAVDYGMTPGAGNGGEKAFGPKVIEVALQCGAKSARCEGRVVVNGQAVVRSVDCGDPAADHVHISAGTCDAN